MGTPAAMHDSQQLYHSAFGGVDLMEVDIGVGIPDSVLFDAGVERGLGSFWETPGCYEVRVEFRGVTTS